MRERLSVLNGMNGKMRGVPHMPISSIIPSASRVYACSVFVPLLLLFRRKAFECLVVIDDDYPSHGRRQRLRLRL